MKSDALKALVTRESAKKLGVRALTVALMAVPAVVAHAAGSGETFTADPTAYAGTMTDTGTYVTAMIATYAPKAIAISVAIGGVGLLWGWARRAVGH